MDWGRWMAAAGLSVLATGCSAFDAVNAVSPPLTTSSDRGIAYGDLPRQRLDVHRGRCIRQDARGSRVPTVVLFYGGGWASGERGDYAFLARAVAEEGFVVIVPDYRIYPEGRFPDYVEDGARAVRWARQHAADFGGDPERLYLMGQSAGAHIAAMLALEPKYLAAVGERTSAVHGLIGLAGPYAFVPRPQDRGPLGLGAISPREQNALRWEDVDPAIEPATHVTPSAAHLKVLLVHGLDDVIVKPENSRTLADRLREVGAQVELTEYPGVGHTETASAFAWPLRWQAPVRRDVASFLRKREPPHH